jgi:hypothetical protein
MHALDEMILYEAALFAEARTIWELRKRSVPAHPVICERIKMDYRGTSHISTMRTKRGRQE